MVMVTTKHLLPQSWYTNGTKIVTVDMERFIPGAKSTNYLSAVFAQQQAKKQGGIEAVYVDRHNRILEGTTTNFFFFKKGKLFTSGNDILPGITRGVILNLARNHYETEIRDINKSELSEMDEVFITASNKEIVPVVKVDDIQIGTGNIGKDTIEIMRLFREYTTAYGEGKV